MKILFRAKTIKQDYKEETESLKCINDVWYAIGMEQPIAIKNFEGVEICAIAGEDMDTHICNYSTRAIHLPNMIDSEENKIFASLDDTKGKGGSIIIDNMERKGIVIFCGFENKPFVRGVNLLDKNIYDIFNNNHDFNKLARIIGIQE